MYCDSFNNLLKTTNFYWLQTQSPHIYNRISLIYDNNINFELSNDYKRIIKRLSNLDEINNSMILIEAYNVENEGISGFIGIEDNNTFIIYTTFIKGIDDLRSKAFSELKDIYNVDSRYIIKQKWLLDYIYSI